MIFKVSYEVRFFQPTELQNDFQIFEGGIIPDKKILEGLIKRYIYPDYANSLISIKITNIVNITGIELRGPSSSIILIDDSNLRPIPQEPKKPEPVTAENNGGKTHYYDLPLPDKKVIEHILEGVIEKTISVESAIKQILLQCPQTLNDLIEFKKMKPWQHEVIKAVYAIGERAEKNGGSVVREINKILYYAERGKKLALDGKEGTISDVFEPTLNHIAAVTWAFVERMQWHNKTNLECLALICQEIGEATQECRGAEVTDQFRLELADIILRTLDLAQNNGIDIEAAIRDKMKLNEELKPGNPRKLK